MKKAITLLFIFIFIEQAYCQKAEKGLGLQIGYSYQHLHKVDLGLNYIRSKAHRYTTKKDIDSLPNSSYNISKKSITTSGINLSVHALFNGSHKVFAQSIGYNYGKSWNSGLGINVGAGVFHYSNSDFRINPTVGISLIEFIYLNYSYSIPISNEEKSYINRNQIGITFRFNSAIVNSIMMN